VGKNKLAHWAEMRSFNNVIQPEPDEVISKEHLLKGKWKRDFFKNDNPVILELGCGKGEYTVGLATWFPENNYIGIDIKGARMWRGAKTAMEKKLPNVAFLRTKIEFIISFFTEDEVDEIWITFPDPYPRKRNSRKRLTSPGFLNSYRSFLKNKGIVHLKTDNIDLYNYTYEVIKQNNLETVLATVDLYSGKTDNEILSIKTHYEKIFLAEGTKIHYLSFKLDKDKTVKDVREKTKK
jgi:tRNA (guanine-N7-)-methyltransferase